MKGSTIVHQGPQGPTLISCSLADWPQGMLLMNPAVQYTAITCQTRGYLPSFTASYVALVCSTDLYWLVNRGTCDSETAGDQTCCTTASHWSPGHVTVVSLQYSVFTYTILNQIEWDLFFLESANTAAQTVQFVSNIQWPKALHPTLVNVPSVHICVIIVI